MIIKIMIIKNTNIYLIYHKLDILKDYYYPMSSPRHSLNGRLRHWRQETGSSESAPRQSTARSPSTISISVQLESLVLLLPFSPLLLLRGSNTVFDVLDPIYLSSFCSGFTF